MSKKAKRWTSEGGTPWFIRVSCITTVAGKRTSFNRMIPLNELDPTTPASTRKWIEENLPPQFHGAMIHISTPIHHNVGIVDKTTGKFKYVMGPNS